MAINPNAVGEKAPPSRFAWTSKDTILYALGVGCGRNDLQFTTENTKDTPQRTLPTFAVIIGTRGLSYKTLGEFDHSKMVHGTQAFEIFEEIPVAGEVEIVASVAGIWDKGSAAVIELESECRDVSTNKVLLKTRHSLFCRGEGGWGGDRGPSASVGYPDRAPDASVTYKTDEDQALVYRLSGDRNPLHSDPAYARLGGFDQPILHGLCTYGITGRGILSALCDNEPKRLRSMNGRFSKPVYPGQALTVQMWKTDDGCVFKTLNDAGEVVLDQGVAKIG